MSQDSGVWLVVRPRTPTSEPREPVALPVPRQACLGLARAVLAGGEDTERWRCLCGIDDALQAWLAAVAADESVVLDGDSPAAGRLRIGLLQRLAEDLVVGSPFGLDAPAAVGELSVEASLLFDSLGRMVEHEKLSARFTESLHAARLEAARELAYGAGHEINNPLANIATRAQALILEEHDPERRRRLATIVDQSFRARDMIGGLMLFARPPKPRVEEADFGDIITAVIDSILPLAASRGARLEFVRPSSAVVALVDRGQVEEALRAIATNAIEAVASGGRVTFSAMSARGGRWCEVTVTDDGSGMDDATMRRAFDPFFSGREAGRGAGLGLSKAWRFVEASGGSVALASRPGAGTVVTVVLPAAQTGRVCPDFPA